MGLGYTIDTPYKVARYGINSAISINHDGILEQLREYYCGKEKKEYQTVDDNHPDKRAERIKLYLNMLQELVEEQFSKLKKLKLGEDNDLMKYFNLLEDAHPLKIRWRKFKEAKQEEQNILEKELKEDLILGRIDVNIMTKADRTNYNKKKEELAPFYSDASAALRGFATSNLSSGLVFSAGMNPRLFAYLEEFPDFFPDENGFIKKKLILKVSDYRSAYIQAMYLAKKGIWVSEFRVESGLNCGGHAFPTEGLLMGPILQEFKDKMEVLCESVFNMCNAALRAKGKHELGDAKIQLGVQGGIGTAEEDNFLRKEFNFDSCGWGSPFLLVPEATNVDEITLQQLCAAKKEDYYLSMASPFGIPYNNLRNSASNKLRLQRIEEGRPGSPCYYKHLAFNTEFKKEGLCTASRSYQDKKLKEIKASNLSEEAKEYEINNLLEKECLCSGLIGSTIVINELPFAGKYDAIAICPGPNLAYFSSVFSLQEMVGHIYGRKNILNIRKRKHVFVNELEMYVDYYLKIKKEKGEDEKTKKYLVNFKRNLISGIQYYQDKYNFIFEKSELSGQEYLKKIA